MLVRSRVWGSEINLSQYCLGMQQLRSKNRPTSILGSVVASQCSRAIQRPRAIQIDANQFDVFAAPQTIKIDNDKHRVGDAPPSAALAARVRGHRPHGAMPTTRSSLPSLSFEWFNTCTLPVSANKRVDYTEGTLAVVPHAHAAGVHRINIAYTNKHSLHAPLVGTLFSHMSRKCVPLARTHDQARTGWENVELQGAAVLQVRLPAVAIFASRTLSCTCARGHARQAAPRTRTSSRTAPHTQPEPTRTHTPIS
eukprot:6214416-Pleurochrysis_carterae.AAC.2